LIHFRIENEKTVEQVSHCQIPTEFGDFELYAYHDSIDDLVHFAMVKGDIDPEQACLVRVHLSNTLCDLAASSRAECGWPLRDVLSHLAEEDSGVVVILQQAETAQQIIEQMQYYQRQDQGQQQASRGQHEDLRTFGLGAQILADLGIRKMRIMSAPKKLHALSGFGLEVVDYVTYEKS